MTLASGKIFLKIGRIERFIRNFYMILELIFP